jgi:hypothetical protein
MLFDFEKYFGHVNFSTFGFTLPPSSRELYKHSCPKQFYYYKISRPEKIHPKLVVKQNYKFFRDGKVIHRVMQVYHENITLDHFGELLSNVKGNKVAIMKKIVEFCVALIPLKFRDFALENYLDHFTNFAFFEHDRMLRIDAVYDIHKIKIFNKYYKPLFSEKKENDVARQHGISYRADVGFILPPGYTDNTTDVICIGDLKSGYGYYTTMRDMPTLTQKIKEQLVFPIPWMEMQKEFDLAITHCVGIYTGKQNAFAYEIVTRDDFLTLYNDLMEMMNATEKNIFPRLYKYCSKDPYKYYCIQEEGLLNRIHYKLGIKKYCDVESMQKEPEKKEP